MSTATDRMLRDWLEEQLLPQPTAQSLGYGRGSKAKWDAMAYRRACKILRFKNKGVKSYDELRILL